MATEYSEAVEEPEADQEDDGSFSLEELIESENIAAELDDATLGRIGEQVGRGYKIDKASRSEWEADTQKAMDLAMQVATAKNYPWPKAANIKYPLLTTAAIQFAARAYPAIVRGPDVVKAQVIGKDEDGKKRERADRIGAHMSWQLTSEMDEWESETDKLLHVLPIVGMLYRKTYFDPEKGRNCSVLATADRVVVNDNCTDLETIPRITEEIEEYPTEVEEKMRIGIWRRVELGTTEGEDPDAPHKFLEQHRRIDLDGDGYPEPYVVTIHKTTNKVVRIVANFRMEGVSITREGEVANIKARQYYTPFRLLPNPTGGWHGIGFGFLMRPINDAVNSTLNQLIDAGHLSNVQGGFIGKGARLKGGMSTRRPGEWTPVDTNGAALRDNLVPLPVREPSNVLFSLLGLLIDAGKDISSVKDVMTGGDNNANASPTTTLALIEQGMQVFSAIYKRIYLSLKSEYGKIYALNSEYLDPDTYFTVLDEQEAIGPEDYAIDDLDIIPVADPSVVTNMQRLARAEFLMGFKDDPYFDGIKIRHRLMEAAGIDDIEDIIVEEPPPNPEIMAKADEMDLKKKTAAQKDRELDQSEASVLSEIAKNQAATMKLLAEAEAIEAGPQIDFYKVQMDSLRDEAALILKDRHERRAIQGVEAPSGEQAVLPAPANGA